MVNMVDCPQMSVKVTFSKASVQHYENSPCQMCLLVYCFSFLPICEHHENWDLFVLFSIVLIVLE